MAAQPRYNRRQFLWRSTATVIAVPTLAQLLAACGSDDPSTSASQGSVTLDPANPVPLPVFEDNPPIESGLSPEAGPLTLLTWADYVPAKIVKDFEKEYGVTVEEVTFNSADEALRKVAVSLKENLRPEDVAARLNAVREYAQKIPAANGKLGVVGFCWGGSMSFQYAAAQAKLDAAVVYYGSAPSDAAALARIQAPVLGLFAGDDARVNTTIPPAEAELKKLGKTFTQKVFEGAGHGFLRQQTGRDGANLRAAQKAWPATLALFRERLK